MRANPIAKAGSDKGPSIIELIFGEDAGVLWGGAGSSSGTLLVPEFVPPPSLASSRLHPLTPRPLLQLHLQSLPSLAKHEQWKRGEQTVVEDRELNE